MDAQQNWAMPHWWHRYQAQQGNFNSIDDGTLAFLSTNFGGLPVLLLPVDYSLPPAPVVPQIGVPAVAPAPLPEARACQAPSLADVPGVTLEELEELLSGAASSTETELAELAAWYRGLPPTAKQEALVNVARSLSFGMLGELPVLQPQLYMPLQQLNAPQQLPAPALNVYCDAGLQLAMPAANPAAAAMAALAPAPGAAPTSRPLGDVTNLRTGTSAVPKAVKQLSSKLHIAHSKKVTPQLPADEVKVLLDYQLRAAEPSRAPWFRDGQPGGPCKREALRPLAVRAQAPQSPAGTGVFVPQAMPPSI